MNCFQWKNQISDYLEGTLPEKEMEKAKLHLSHCKDCTQAEKRFQTILYLITHEPKIQFPQSTASTHSFLCFPYSWKNPPWFLRILLEGIITLLFIITIIYSIQTLKALYEKKENENLSHFKQENNTLNNPPLKKEENKDPQKNPILEKNPENKSQLKEKKHFAFKQFLETKKSELWRFSLKTISPNELRTHVIEAFTKMGIPKDTPGFDGNQVPGGIEFDMILPHPLILELKKELSGWTATASSFSQETPFLEHFSWYRIRAKQKLPEGHSQVIIWLSQSQ